MMSFKWHPFAFASSDLMTLCAQPLWQLVGGPNRLLDTVVSNKVQGRGLALCISRHMSQYVCIYMGAYTHSLSHALNN